MLLWREGGDIKMLNKKIALIGIGLAAACVEFMWSRLSQISEIWGHGEPESEVEGGFEVSVWVYDRHGNLDRIIKV